MTFEEGLREFLADKLSVALGTGVTLGDSYEFTPKNVESANGFFFAPLEEDSNSIAMMLRAAAPTRSKSPNVEITSESIIVTLITVANEADGVKEAIRTFEDEYNAQFFEDITDYTTQLIFLDCEVVDTPYDLQTNSVDSDGYTTTEKVANINWTMRAVFTKTVALGEHTYQLKIGSTTYDINGRFTCDFSDGINYAPPVKAVGATRDSYRPTTITTTYNFIIQELKDDALHAILFSGFVGTRTIGINTAVSLIIDGTTVLMATNAINYIDQNGVGTFNLLLTR